MGKRASAHNWIIWSLGAVVFVICACSEDRPVIKTNLKLGPEGGTLKLDDGSAEVVIPPGAIKSEEEISISRIADDQLPAGGIPGTMIEMGPSGQTFEEPVALTISYDPQDLPVADTRWLRMVEVKPEGGLGATLFMAHDKEAHRLTAGLTHFSVYVLVDLATSAAVVQTSQEPIKDVDVLFMVDNSGSMEQEQINLAQNFPVLIEKIEAAQMDYRVGVISSDLGAGDYGHPSCEVSGGDAGALETTPRISGCQPPTDPWIQKVDGKTNVPGDDVSAAFACIAKLGIGGCGFESQLEAVYQALETNPGFLRAAAALVVVYITDEDDCSAVDPTLFDPANQEIDGPLGPLTSFRCFEHGIVCDEEGRELGVRNNCEPGGAYLHPVSRYINQLKALKPGGQVLVSAIAGSVEPVEVGLDGNNPTLKPSCKTANGFAVPGIRLNELVSAFGDRGLYTSICEGNFEPAMSKLADLVSTKASLSWCLNIDAVDTNPLTPAVDADCMAEGSVVGPLLACQAGASAPCFAVWADDACPASKLRITAENITSADLGDTLQVTCLTPAIAAP